MISTLNNYAHDWWKIPSQINTPSIFNDQLKFEIRWYIEPSPDGYLVCSEAGEWRRLSYGMAAIKWVLILQMSPWKINGSSVGSLNRSVPTSTGTLKVEKPKRQRFQALTESPEFITMVLPSSIVILNYAKYQRDSFGFSEIIANYPLFISIWIACNTVCGGKSTVWKFPWKIKQIVQINETSIIPIVSRYTCSRRSLCSDDHTCSGC